MMVLKSYEIIYLIMYLMLLLFSKLDIFEGAIYETVSLISWLRKLRKLGWVVKEGLENVGWRNWRRGGNRGGEDRATKVQHI